MRVALISEDQVQQVFESRIEIAHKYHPDFVASLVDVPDYVQRNWVLVDGEWMSKRPLPRPTIEEVKGAAQSRIESAYPLWKQLNNMRTSQATQDEMSAYIDAVRMASNELELTLPVDYKDDKHWPVRK